MSEQPNFLAQYRTSSASWTAMRSGSEGIVSSGIGARCDWPHQSAAGLRVSLSIILRAALRASTWVAYDFLDVCTNLPFSSRSHRYRPAWIVQRLILSSYGGGAVIIAFESDELRLPQITPFSAPSSRLAGSPWRVCLF